MLKFKTTTLLFALVLILLVAFSIITSLNIIFIILLLILYLVILVYGSYSICSGFYVKTYCSAKIAKREIAITFDDGPNGEVTGNVLNILKDSDIKACFFLIGENATHNEDIIERMNNEGHLIGNHSFAHSNYYDLYSSGRMMDDLMATENAIFKITGRKTRLFRPPFGVTNPAVKKSAAKLNYLVIGWSIRSLDGTISDPDKIFKRVCRRLKPGAIILFHDNHPKILSILSRFIEYVTKNEYKIVRLDTLLNITSYK
ncbi:MAG: polysaccharide deacetylase family protein [Bacteroidetes bacterium]|nr:polysaccharide deacetylase family protein [Bacteroidota bacterium]